MRSLQGDQTLSISGLARYKDLSKIYGRIKNSMDLLFLVTTITITRVPLKLSIRYFLLIQSIFTLKKVPALAGEGGIGNFSFNYFYNNEPFYNLYFLDSQDELKKKETDSLSEYKYLSTAQVEWYDQKAKADKMNDVYSSVFMHIPLVQYHRALEPWNRDELDREPREGVSSQSKDTGFFDSCY